MFTHPQLDSDAPWKRRFRGSNILYTKLAGLNPDRGLAVSNQTGVYQLYAWNATNNQLTQLTDEPAGRLSGYIAPDGHHVYYHADHDGNELGHYVRVGFEGGPTEVLTPHLPTYSSYFLAFSALANALGFLAAGPNGFKLFIQPFEPSGELSPPRLLAHFNRLARGPFLSFNAGMAVVACNEQTNLQHYSLVAFDAHTGERLAELSDGDRCSLNAFGFSSLPGDTRLLATSTRTGVERPLLWDPLTGERRDLDLPDLPGDIALVDWSADADRVLLCQTAQAVQQLYIYTFSTGALTRLVHPDGSYSFSRGYGSYFSPTGEIFTQWQAAAHPPQVVALDAQSGKRVRSVLTAGAVPECRPWQSVTFRSSDSEPIQAWLATPAGDGPFPTILHAHGGPEAATLEWFDPESQAWLDHGFAYLTVNYRGSTTFGRRFQEQIWGHPGDLELEDLAAARAWLVGSGFAHASQVFLSGPSYGGFLTLLGLGRYPALWAGGLAEVAIADWNMTYADSNPILQGYQAAIFDGKPDEKPEQHARSSPITYAADIQAPILIIQGRNDTRTPARQLQAYEDRLRSLGKPIEVHWFEAGHMGGFAQVEQAILNQERKLRFAYRVLAG